MNNWIDPEILPPEEKRSYYVKRAKHGQNI